LAVVVADDEAGVVEFFQSSRAAGSDEAMRALFITSAEGSRVSRGPRPTVCWDRRRPGAWSALPQDRGRA
jgi:hypothetical protein